MAGRSFGGVLLGCDGHEGVGSQLGTSVGGRVWRRGRGERGRDRRDGT
jgi:hypothetical protein